MKMTDEDYAQLVEKKSPNSTIGKDLLLAFVIGGGICCVGQLLLQIYYTIGMWETLAKTAVTVSMVFLGAFLTGLGIYDKLAVYAGAGTLVPITGFANSVAAPALDFKSEGFILGTGTKMFVIAGPVIVYGTTASVIYGIVYWLWTRVFLF